MLGGRLSQSIGMEIDIESLARYPTESDDWIATVLIGGLALLFSFLIVPLFAVAGYGVRVIRAGMDDADEPPVFDEWGELLREGFVASVIGFVYQIPPLIVLVVFVGGSLVALLTGTDAGAGLGLVGLLGGVLVWWLLSLVFGYVGFAGVANYAREGTFGAGFDFGVITDVVTDGDYLLAWAYIVVLNVVVGVVTSVLNAVPFLGAIVGVFVGFYALIIAGWLLGNGFAAATGYSPDVSTDDEATAA